MTIELATLLAAIAVVESNTNDAAIGKAGERGRYQITREVWEKWMPKSQARRLYGAGFDRGPHDPALSRWVAERHIKYGIIPELEKAGRQVTVFAVASCWNAGVEGYIKHDRGSKYAWKVVEEYARKDNE
jgi:hypothetical protein